MEANICYYNGAFLPFDKVGISPLDVGFLRAYGAFEALRTYQRIPFETKAHFARLENTLDSLEIALPFSFQTFENLLSTLLEHNPGAKDLAIRLIITGGVSCDFITPSKPTVLMMCSPLPSIPSELYENGCHLKTFSHQRTDAEMKTLNYTFASRSLREAKRLGFHDALYVFDQHSILEGTTVNFFSIADGILHTAPNNILEGVTRKVLLEIAQEEGIPIELSYPRLDQKIDEALITSTYKEVMPVSKIDDRDLPVGPLTERLMECFSKRTSINDVLVTQ